MFNVNKKPEAASDIMLIYTDCCSKVAYAFTRQLHNV